MSPSPYMYNINFGDICIIGSSPEGLISKNKDLLNKVPIAGTIRHGKTPEKDLKLENGFYHIRFILF
ncbi:MAG: chorismate-binding protein [Promethearchaeota archaeon]